MGLVAFAARSCVALGSELSVGRCLVGMAGKRAAMARSVGSKKGVKVCSVGTGLTVGSAYDISELFSDGSAGAEAELTAPNADHCERHVVHVQFDGGEVKAHASDLGGIEVVHVYLHKPGKVGPLLRKNVFDNNRYAYIAKPAYVVAVHL